MVRAATPTDWNSVAAVLRSVFPPGTDPEQLRVYRAWEIWPDVVGADVARGARPTKFRDGKLVVTVYHPALMQDLHFVKEHLRGELNRGIGKDLIRRIHFVRGALRPEDVAPTTAAQRPAPRYSEIEPPPVHDPELEAAFLSLLEVRRTRLTEAESED